MEPRLETKRLQLRLPTDDDGVRLAEYYQHNREFFGPWSPRRAEDYYTEVYWRTQLPLIRQEFVQGRSVRLIAVGRARPQGPMIGEVNLTNIVRGFFQAANLSYSLDESLQGKGLATEAVGRAVDYAFDELKLHRVMANYMPTNERSGRLLRRLGFAIEGYARDYLFICGRWQDHVLTARTSPHPRPAR